MQLVLPHLQPSDRVLDIGAGAGRHAVYLAQQVAHVVAVEPSFAMRQQLERRLAATPDVSVTLCRSAGPTRMCQSVMLPSARMWSMACVRSARSCCGWALGWLVTRAAGVDLTLQWSVFGSSGALTFQLLAGLALAWLLPQAKAL